MIALLAFVDSLVGAHYLTAGVYRLYLIGTLVRSRTFRVPNKYHWQFQQDLVLVTTWSCLWTAHNMFFIFGGPASEAMMICVTLDRLVAVYLPMVKFISNSTISRHYRTHFRSTTSTRDGTRWRWWRPSTVTVHFLQYGAFLSLTRRRLCLRSSRSASCQQRSISIW